MKKEEPSFEQGPIRPPSEAQSLLVRVTRNCTWNKCGFCPVYKGQEFSRRSVDEVKEDIRAMAHWHGFAVDQSWKLGFGGRLDGPALQAVYDRNQQNPHLASILVWLSGGGHTAFLQDANNLVLEPENLAAMLRFLRETFPPITRVTSYARSSTLARRDLDELRLIRDAGLNRLHVGMESGSNAVLRLVEKGVTAEKQVVAGQKAKQAGFELSEYIMPGLGGRALSKDHAAGTAAVLTAIDPDFIRIRTTGLRPGMPLYDKMAAGQFEMMSDDEMAAELRDTIAGLGELHSIVVSDHILNLLPEVEGRLPGDRDKMLAVIDRYLALPEPERLAYMVGRRLGLMDGVEDLADPRARSMAEETIGKLRQIDPDVNAAVRKIAAQFI